MLKKLKNEKQLLFFDLKIKKFSENIDFIAIHYDRIMDCKNDSKIRDF